MLHATLTLDERKCPEHCRLPSSLVENGTETGSKKFSAFWFHESKAEICAFSYQAYEGVDV
jgi:hypothetical protein